MCVCVCGGGGGGGVGVCVCVCVCVGVWPCEYVCDVVVTERNQGAPLRAWEKLGNRH